MIDINSLVKEDSSPVFYQNYPRLFAKYFTDINPEVINQLSKAGYFYYHSTLLTDSLIDDKEFANFPMITLLQEETIKMLTSVYGKDSDFWKYWNQRRQEYFTAVKIEKKLDYDSNISLTEYEDLADKKAAFGKVAIDCLYLLSNKADDELYRLLLKSHYYFSVGFQLYDDVKDFKEDFEKGQFNWALYQQRNENYHDKYKGDIRTLNKLLFINGMGPKIMTQSISYFKKAIKIIEDLKGDSEWKEVIFEMKQTIESYLDITVGYIKTIERRIEIKDNKYGLYNFFNYDNVQNKMVKNALHYLKDCYLKNYSDLKHIMYLSNQEGFENYDQVHVSDVFQRAMLNDCLMDVCKEYKVNVADFFDFECDYLIGQRNPDAIGAWSYFPKVKEIAADIDDLGQIMQLFIKSGNRKHIANYCQNAIDLTLSDRVTESGGIETWIVPKQNRNVLQEKQENFNSTKWGKGPDVEVVANFVYALSIYDSTQYESTIKNAISFILENQNHLGFWESRWYYGNFYGTYVCLRLLNEYDEQHSIYIQKGLEYILEEQNLDGGFSMLDSGKSDALTTAFALLSLKLFFSKDHKSVVRAIDYLKTNQHPSGYWEAINFIKPKAQEPYKSKTITTAFVIKALCNVN
ncbi:prenyltransferase [Maribacter sp. MJ134]|uniref:prenyltransferase/squalene oxidase repeat-containing protein n=1 Tax=Maribacter sp. MJ134 TaxID=2496865 RepID=UPI000F82972B|nr:prenyltransferase/squalene oxidase repeat-containing protein [Maribacter sp. MJ134]AZQ59887.1 prenyltransferase [Maribacter sp. MJ134]